MVKILDHPETDIGERVSLEGSIEAGKTVNDLNGKVNTGE